LTGVGRGKSKFSADYTKLVEQYRNIYLAGKRRDSTTKMGEAKG